MADRVSWTVHRVKIEDGYNDYAILPDDLTRGLFIGEMEDVQALYDALTQFLEAGEQGEPIARQHEQLGYLWLSTSEAAEKYDVPTSTITWACRQGLIEEATQDGRGWRFPGTAFRAWMMKRPGSGREYNSKK
jgi:hypothetical protein